MVAEGTPLTGPEVSLGLRQAPRVFGALMRQATQAWALALAPVRVEMGLVGRRNAVMRVAARRGLPLGLPVVPGAGRPRRLDYTELSVLLASGVTHADAARRLGVSRSAVSKAWFRNRELRRRVNRVEHAAFG